DGNNVVPVDVDELQIAVAETYDVVVQPAEDRAYTLAAESVDRSGMARATLAPRLGMTAKVPPLRRRPTLGMENLGMGGMDHGAMSMRDKAHAPSEMKVGAGVDMISMNPPDGAGKRGLGLEDVDHRVLVYTDLV